MAPGLVLCISHSVGPRARAMVGGVIDSLKVDEDVTHRRRLGDKGDDSHVGAAAGAPEREHRLDAGE